MRKRFFLSLLCLIIIIVGYTVYSSFKRKIIVTGFAYEKDIISIKQSKKLRQVIDLDGHKINANRIYSFYETLDCFTLNGDVTLTIEIDSARHKLLDTTIVLRKENKIPFISFENPTETKSIRSFFIGDQAAKELMPPY